MKFTHIRHGSHLIEYGGKTILVDPVFSETGTFSALPMGRVKSRNPLNKIPFSLDFINKVDAVLITHTHFDHFDKKAQEILPKDTLIICHNLDAKTIRKFGFTNIKPLDGPSTVLGRISIDITGGRHGTGIAGFLMGRTTGYILKDTQEKEPSVYLIGDSIWYDHIEDTLRKHNPDHIIVFAGEARLMGSPITMSTGDIDAIAAHSEGNIIAVHMDAWNHCFLTRDGLRQHARTRDYYDRLIIPENGESFDFS